MPRLREIPRSEVTDPKVLALYDLLFGDRDPVAEPGTATGTRGDWWTVFAACPPVLDHAARGFALYRDPRRKLDPVLRELAQTRAGWTRGSQFVFSQHCKSLRDLGVGEDKIAAVPAWQVSEVFDAHERAVLAYADGLVLDGGRVADGVFEALKGFLDDEQILELTYITCLYEMHAVMSRALRLEFDDRPESIVEIAAPEDEIAAFMAQAGLPPRFADLAARLHAPLAERIARAAAGRSGPLVVGLCGPQGSGKSTLVALVARLLRGRGLKTANLSLDDLYLTRAERLALGETVHPLLRTRGVPGTHDIGLGLSVLDALARSGPVLLPRFDKAADDRVSVSDFEPFDGPVDVILLEGWCVGARAQPEAALVEPVNALERDEDPAGVWRRHANAALAGPYRALFDRIDLLVVMTAPDFPTVQAWRGQQEQRLREDLAAHGRAPSLAMDDAALDRFVAHYQRLTEWIADDLPPRADIVIRLDPDREPVEMRGV